MRSGIHDSLALLSKSFFLVIFACLTNKEIIKLFMDSDDKIIEKKTGIIEHVEIDQEMRSAYIDYSMSVIVSRALPDVRDGLKPVQRRVLYGMDGLGLQYSGPTRKCAKKSLENIIPMVIRASMTPWPGWPSLGTSVIPPSSDRVTSVQWTATLWRP